MTPGKRASPAAILVTTLRRSSSLTGTDCQPDSRSWPRVAGRDVMPPNLPLYLSGMRRGGEQTPWGIWALGWMIAIVLTGGVVYVITDTESPVRVFNDPVVVETSIHDVTVLPGGLSRVQGTLTALHGTDVTAPALRTPLEFPAGAGATIENALVGGKRATIVWDG